MFHGSIKTEESAPGAATPGQPAGSGPGMLRSSMTCARLREWVKLAQPGARLTYGEGALLAQACTPEVKALVMHLAEREWLTPHFIRGRDGEPSRYIVQRTQRPYVKGMEL